MGAWLESYNQLPEEHKDRVQRWLHLNKFIAQTLRIPWERWVDDYLQPCMDAPLDYSFMRACLPAFTGMEAGGSFEAGGDPATRLVSKVPVRAQNNLGRLSPDLQDAIAALLESDDPAPITVSPADLVQLQKIFPKEKALSKLKKKDLRRVVLSRDGDDATFLFDGGDDLEASARRAEPNSRAAADARGVGRRHELLRINVLELGAVMRKPLL